MLADDLFTPCTVGDLRLPAKFSTVVHLLYCHTAAGQPTRAWVYLPAGMFLSLNCPLQEHDVELWSFGPLSLTRPMTEEELADLETY